MVATEVLTRFLQQKQLTSFSAISNTKIIHRFICCRDGDHCPALFVLFYCCLTHFISILLGGEGGELNRCYVPFYMNTEMANNNATRNWKNQRRSEKGDLFPVSKISINTKGTWNVAEGTKWLCQTKENNITKLGSTKPFWNQKDKQNTWLTCLKTKQLTINLEVAPTNKPSGSRQKVNYVRNVKGPNSPITHSLPPQTF